MPEHSVITRVVRVAKGVFAPGHLGELTQVIPFELVDAVLAETGRTQRRLRLLPSRVGVYFVLALCLFPQVGYRLVWATLTGGLAGLPVAWPSTTALRKLRRRVGAAPLQALFEVLAGAVAQPTTPGVRFGRWRTVSFDGCTSQKVPDTQTNWAWLGRCGRNSYPMLELMTLVETGTRALIGAVFGPTRTGEVAYATRLLGLLTPDMLLLWDKGFDANAFLTAVHEGGAAFLGRCKASRRPPVLARLHDGSYRSMIADVPVRIIEATITITCADATSYTGTYRLVTSLHNHRVYPAATLIGLYHQRWEHESAYYSLRHTLLDGRVLRSGDPAGIHQEMWALMVVYQALRVVMLTAAETQPGTDPDRISFTTALHTARQQVITATGIITTPAGPIGEIGRQALNTLMPPRRARVSARKVKTQNTRYFSTPTDGRPLTSRNITNIHIHIHQPPTPLTTRPEP